MIETKIDYGDTGLKVSLESRNMLDIITSKPVRPISDPETELIRRFEDPIGTISLREKISGKKDICIVISDSTRAVPTRFILKVLLNRLKEYGIKKQNVKILIATGLHRPNLGEELENLVGFDVASQYRIINHYARDRKGCSFIGNTKRGTEININREYVESDFKILTGLIEPHFMAGFSGGRKSICPGISYKEMFKIFHGPEILESPNSTNLVLKNNPFHEESTEIALKAGVDFIINMTINKEKEITGIFCGDLIKAYEEGASFSLDQNVYNIREEADIVITSGGGQPLDATLYQAVKGMVAALPAVKKGGTIIIASDCREGIGSKEFTELLLEENDLDVFMKKIKTGEYFKIDQWQLEKLVEARKKADIFLYSENINRLDCKIPEGTLRLFDSVNDALNAAIKKTGSRAKISVIPEGPYVIPVCQ